MQPTVTIHPSSLLCVIANGFILTNILSIESISVYIRVLKRKSSPPAPPHLSLHQPGKEGKRKEVGGDQHRKNLLPIASPSEPTGQQGPNGGSNTAGAVDDGGDRGKSLAAAGQGLVGAQLGRDGSGDESVGSVHQEAGQHQQQGVDQVAGVDDWQAPHMRQRAPDKAGLVDEQGGYSGDQHGSAGGGGHAGVVGDHPCNHSADNATDIEKRAQGCGTPCVKTAGGGDVVGKPEEESVADQLGEEEAEAELDHTGNAESSTKSNCSALTLIMVDQAA